MRASRQPASVALVLGALCLGGSLTSVTAAGWVPAESVSNLPGLGVSLGFADCRAIRYPFGECSDSAAGSDDIVTGSISRNGQDPALEPLVEQVRARLLQSASATD